MNNEDGVEMVLYATVIKLYDFTNYSAFFLLTRDSLCVEKVEMILQCADTEYLYRL